MPEPEHTQESPSRPPGPPPPPTDPTAQWQADGSGGRPGPHPARIGRYAIRAVLGEGAFGRVYHGFDAELGREVAIKVPHAQGLTAAIRERFLREARAAATIHHPNVCPIYDVGTDGDLPFIVMRFIAGGTLADLLARRKGPPPVRFAVATARQLALGVAAAHAENVIHRDLKPQNVLWDEARRLVVVTDFGLARVGGELGLTGKGDMLGTPHYMSPEQWRGDPAQIGPPADVYALGVILYRMLAGETPYQGSVLEIMAQACEGTANRPSAHRPELNPALDALCMKAMAIRIGDRYPSARAFADALMTHLRGTEGGGDDGDLPEALPEPPPPQYPPRGLEPVKLPGWETGSPGGRTRGPATDPTPRTGPRQPQLRPNPPPPPPPGGEAPSALVACPRCHARMRVVPTRTKPVPCPMCQCLFSMGAGRQAAARSSAPPPPNRGGRPSGANRAAIPLVAPPDDGHDSGPRPEWKSAAGGLTMAWVGGIVAAVFALLAVGFHAATLEHHRHSAGTHHHDPLPYWAVEVAIGLGAAGGLALIGVGRLRAGSVPKGVRGAGAGRISGVLTLIGTAGLTGSYALVTRIIWYDGGDGHVDPLLIVGRAGYGVALTFLVVAEWAHHLQLTGIARRVPDFPYMHAATTRVLLLLTMIPAVVGMALLGYSAYERVEGREAGAMYGGLMISMCGAMAFLPLWLLSAQWLTGRAATAVGRHARGDD